MDTLSKPRNVCSRAQHTARRAGNKKGQTTQRSVGTIADGFLKHQFLQLYEAAVNTPEKRQVEQGFFKSLSSLSSLYGCEIMDVEDKPYPYNVLLAHWDISRKLEERLKADVAIVKDDAGKVCLSTTQTCYEGNTLYYIPVLPVYRLLKDRTRKRCGELLLSVFSYFYHVVQVPYYRDSYSCMDYQYDMLKEWILDDRESYQRDELNAQISEFDQAAYYGDDMHRKLFNRYNLDQFVHRVKQFKPSDEWEQECLRLAAIALDLFHEYPDRSIFSRVQRYDEYCDGETISAEYYIHFVAESKGWLAEQVEQSVNSYLQECSRIEEPTITQLFNRKGIEKETLDFEHRFFSLLEDLCTLLNEIS